MLVTSTRACIADVMIFERKIIATVISRYGFRFVRYNESNNEDEQNRDPCPTYRPFRSVIYYRYSFLLL